VEQNRTPAVRPDLDELAWPAANQHEVIVNLIAGTTIHTGLTVTAGLDDTIYPKGIKITDREMADLETQHLTRHDFHFDWNYTVSPADQP
jgi:hypothetical protein